MLGVLATGSTDAATMEGILALATQIVTWVITTMGSYLKFVTDNPIILFLFLVSIAGMGIGFLMRIWKNV